MKPYEKRLPRLMLEDQGRFYKSGLPIAERAEITLQQGNNLEQMLFYVVGRTEEGRVYGATTAIKINGVMITQMTSSKILPRSEIVRYRKLRE